MPKAITIHKLVDPVALESTITSILSKSVRTLATCSFLTKSKTTFYTYFSESLPRNTVFTPQGVGNSLNNTNEVLVRTTETRTNPTWPLCPNLETNPTLTNPESIHFNTRVTAIIIPQLTLNVLSLLNLVVAQGPSSVHINEQESSVVLFV